MCAAGWLRSAGSSAWVMLTVPHRLTSISQRISSIVSWSMSPSIEDPAHVMRVWTWGWDAATSAATRFDSAVIGEVHGVGRVPGSGERGRERRESFCVAVEQSESRTASIQLARDFGAHAARRPRDDAGASSHVEPLHPGHHRPSAALHAAFDSHPIAAR